jgi:hypothetical protein
MKGRIERLQKRLGVSFYNFTEQQMQVMANISTTWGGVAGSLLCYAVRYGGDDQDVRTLLDLGANCNGRNEDVGSPLYFATVRMRLDIVQVLCEAGATIVGPSGRSSPLACALGMHQYYPEATRIVEYFFVEREVPIPQISDTWGMFSAVVDMRLRVEYCHMACMESVLCMQRLRIHKDVIRLIVRTLWKTRRTQVWKINLG